MNPWSELLKFILGIRHFRLSDLYWFVRYTTDEVIPQVRDWMRVIRMNRERLVLIGLVVTIVTAFGMPHLSTAAVPSMPLVAGLGLGAGVTKDASISFNADSDVIRARVQVGPSLAEQRKAEEAEKRAKLASAVDAQVAKYDAEQAAKAAAAQAARSAQTSVVGAIGQPSSETSSATGNVRYVTVTAYSSTPDQTNGDPFTMASGRRVYSGAIALNGLPFGTKVKFPDYYGDRVFTVEDRTSSRYGALSRADIWMGTRGEALQWGIKRNVRIEIL